MENGQQTIFTLFNGDKHFIIPKYQRAYSWEEKQLRDFIEDIENQKTDKDYFIGTLLFQAQGVKNSFEQIEIVDGQQRLITIVIFMKVLLKMLSEKHGKEKYIRDMRRFLKDESFYKIELVEMDNEFFKTYIIEDNESEDKFLRTPSQRKLLIAKKFFESTLSGFDINKIEEMKKKVEKTKLLVYSVVDTAEATLIFETTNDRGKTLTNLEKMKSFLMYKVYLTKDKPLELLSSIHDRFSDIYRILEEINNKVDEDSILQYHFISHLMWSYTRNMKDYQKHVEITKNKINTLMKSDDLSKASSFIDSYSRELKETFEVMKEILNDNNTYVKDLFLLGRMALFYPLMIKCYKLDTSRGKNSFYDIVRLLEKFSFRVYAFAGKLSKTGETWLYSIAKDFKGDFPRLKSDLKEKIKDYVDDYYFDNLLRSEELYNRVSSRDLRYLFWKYENFLRTTEQPLASDMSISEFSSQDSRFKLTIEHIASRTPQVSTPQLILPDIDDEFEKKYLHSIGNLTFDPNSANSSKGNQGIAEKNSKYFIRAPFKTQNELDNFIENGKWTKNSIIQRAEKIIGFAKDYWNLE